MIIFDNVEEKLHSPILAAALTSVIWGQRLLGGNEKAKLSNTATWIATGNNIQLGGDLPRRCYAVTMESTSARPWQENKKFKHPDLIPWVLEYRTEILEACLTLTMAWIAAKRPKPSDKVPLIGGFEDWRIVIGGVLEKAGFEGFLANLELMYEDADTDTYQWEAFLEKCNHLYPDKSFTVAELNKVMEDQIASDLIGDRLIDCLPDDLADAFSNKKAFVRKLGNALSKVRNRIFSNKLTLKKSGIQSRAITYTVKKVE